MERDVLVDQLKVWLDEGFANMLNAPERASVERVSKRGRIADPAKGRHRLSPKRLDGLPLALAREQCLRGVDHFGPGGVGGETSDFIADAGAPIGR